MNNIEYPLWVTGPWRGISGSHSLQDDEEGFGAPQWARCGWAAQVIENARRYLESSLAAATERAVDDGDWQRVITLNENRALLLALQARLILELNRELVKELNSGTIELEINTMVLANTKGTVM